MIIADSLLMQSTESRIMTGVSRVWGDVGENGSNKLVWEFKNYESGME